MTDDEREDMAALIREAVARADRIEQDRQGRALTPDEVTLVRGAAFLRKIAPYVFQPKDQ